MLGCSVQFFHFVITSITQINTIANIRHSAFKGETVLLCQTDKIHECFYDLFNQRFRCINDPAHGPRYYANIAIGAHTKPSRVSPSFQCAVVLNESEIRATPSPFLNRFEKYLLSHKAALEVVLLSLSPCMRIVVEAAFSMVSIAVAVCSKTDLHLVVCYLILVFPSLSMCQMCRGKS